MPLHGGEFYGLHETFKVMYSGLSFGEAQMSKKAIRALKFKLWPVPKAPLRHCCMDHQPSFKFTSFFFPMQRETS